MNKPIGIMDSGVGGLTVMKEIMHALPNEQIYYFADSLNCPYGEKNIKDVERFTVEACNFLVDKGIKMLIVACNTATAAALPALRESLDIPVVGVINPGALGATRASQNKNVLLLATRGTVESGVYNEEILKFDSSINIQNLACPEFVTLIENLEYEDESYAREVIAEKLEAVKDTPADTIILGCTHFPIIQPFIEEFFNYKKKIVDAGFETVSIVLSRLHRKNLLAAGKTQAPNKIYINGQHDHFEKILKTWIPNLNYVIKNINLQVTR